MARCQCGYECRLPGEQEMLDKWGCAKAIEKRSTGPFGNIEMTMCPSNTVSGDNGYTGEDDGSAYKEAFLQKYEKPKTDGNNPKN